MARTLQLTFGDQRFGYFVMNGKQYQIIGQLDRPFRNEPDDLKRLQVRARDGQARLARQPGHLAGAHGAGGALPLRSLRLGDRLGRHGRRLHARRRYPRHGRGGARSRCRRPSTAPSPAQAREFADSSSSLLFAFALALLIVYLVLAAQFESFVDPFIILLSVPLALSGAVLSLRLTGSSLNIFSQIGIIMLVGLVTKNGILIVEFANQRRDAGARSSGRRAPPPRSTASARS